MQKKNTSYETATGIIDFPLTNDYMFRAVLQNNQMVLKGLTASLLHLDPDTISSIEITNPIVLGESIDNKDFILDILLILNNSLILNLEMQISNEHNWPDRSLSYLCRNFDQVSRGENYDTAKPVIHIGILDFSLFPDDHQFYSTFKLLDVKTHQVFNDKFQLSVLYLNHIEQATEEDHRYKIDYWARLFKAKTWEELRMIAADNPYMTQASKSLYMLNEDQMIQPRCRAREEYERHERTMKKLLDDVTAERDFLLDENETLSTKNDALASENDALVSENDALHSEVEALKALLKENKLTQD